MHLPTNMEHFVFSMFYYEYTVKYCIYWEQNQTKEVWILIISLKRELEYLKLEFSGRPVFGQFGETNKKKSFFSLAVQVVLLNLTQM